MTREKMMMQRKRNLPVRWFNVGRVDPRIVAQLKRGTWQSIIPVNPYLSLKARLQMMVHRVR